MTHQAGQYLHVNLPHEFADNRGTKRFFTIASAPEEEGVSITSKFTSPGSSFKQHFHRLQPGDTMFADEIGGDFVLPDRVGAPLLLIAGGVGVAPFRSMIQSMLLTKTLRPLTLVYVVKSPDEFVFQEIFDAADTQGATIIRMLSEPAEGWTGSVGRADAPTLSKLVPNLPEHEVYVSGPEGMVEAIEKFMPTLGVPVEKLHRDFFPGYQETYQR